MIPHLTLSIDTKEPGASSAKCTIANTSSVSGKSPDKRRRTGRALGRGYRWQTTGKCRVVGGKVVGMVEGLHYTDEIWKAMSKEQKAKVAELCKARSNERALKAACTAPAGTIPMDVSDQLQTLTCAVQSLDSSRDSGRRSTDRHSSSRRRGTQLRSSSRSHGSHQLGAHAGHRER